MNAINSAVHARDITRADRPTSRRYRDAELQSWHDLLESLDGDD
jgi:hypothetical protein